MESKKLKVYMVCYRYTSGSYVESDKIKLFSTKEKAKQYFDILTINKLEQRRIDWYDEDAWDQHLMGADFIEVVKRDDFFDLDYDDGDSLVKREQIAIREIEID